MSRTIAHLWKILVVSELNHVMSRKVWIQINRIPLKSKGRNPVPVKWVLNRKEEPDRLIR